MNILPQGKDGINKITPKKNLTFFLFRTLLDLLVAVFFVIFLFVRTNPNTDLSIQGDQLNKALCFWYLIGSDFSCVHLYSSVHWISHILQRTRKTRPCLTGHPVLPRGKMSRSDYHKMSLNSEFASPRRIWEENGAEGQIDLLIIDCLFPVSKFLSSHR